MAKRDQAYELFDKGKTPGDFELKALGLQDKSLRKYYRDWKKLRPAVMETPIVAVAPVAEAPAPPSEVQLGSLRIAAKFEFKGEKYRVANKIEDSVVVDKFREVTSDEDAIWQHLAHLTLSPHVMVKPIK